MLKLKLLKLRNISVKYSRFYEKKLKIFKDLEYASVFRYLICANGANLKRRKQRKVLHLR